jgi:hypothetical protein
MRSTMCLGAICWINHFWSGIRSFRSISSGPKRHTQDLDVCERGCLALVWRGRFCSRTLNGTRASAFCDAYVYQLNCEEGRWPPSKILEPEM